MNNTDKLDVLVVYSAGVAVSASVKDSYSKYPFLMNSKQANYNLSYGYFLDACKRQGLKAGFTTSGDIINSGECNNYWKHQDSVWTKINRKARAFHVFDKISPVSPIRMLERELMLSDGLVRSFNDPELFKTFFDKLITYKKLPKYAIPTVKIKSNKVDSISKSLGRLRQLIDQHKFSGDFAKKFVLKDRYGAGGNQVYKIGKNFEESIRKIMLSNPEVKFILQPFLLFDKGYGYKNHKAATDLRLIYQYDEILQSYIRMASGDDFRCNEHQGGELVYVTENDIPENVLKIANKIVKRISKPRSLYALDFVISNTGHVYFVEGNIGPGIDWDINKKVNETKSKQLINSIVKEISRRVKKPKFSNVFTPIVLEPSPFLAPLTV